MIDASRRQSTAVQAVRFDHACFGCGDDNPIGLHLRFAPTDDGVSAPFTPATVHRGFDGIVHGGIFSTLPDEAMAWATTSAGVWSVTAELSVRFKEPLSVGVPTTVRAPVTEKRGRIIEAAGELTRDRDGAIVAAATGTFVRVSDAVAIAWESRYLENGWTDKNVSGDAAAVNER